MIYVIPNLPFSIRTIFSTSVPLLITILFFII